MNNTRGLLSAIILSVLLTACGGGGDDGGTTPTTPTTPVNHAPTLSLAESSISMMGSSTTDVAITATDEDGDELTYSFSSTSPVLSASVNGDSLVITASDVEASTNATLIVTVSDGKDSVAKEITVIVTKYVAYSVTWVDAESVNLSVAQAAKARFPFVLELGSLSEENITYSVSMNVDAGLNQSAISAAVSSEGKEVVVSPSKENQGDYTGVLTVTDGITTETLNFSLNVYYAVRAPFMDSERFVFLEEGETKTFEMSSTEILDADSLAIFEAEPFEVLEGDASKIAFDYDNTAKTYSFTALEGSKFSGFLVRINTTDSFDGRAGAAYEIYVKGATTSQERELEEKIVLAQKFVKQSQEMERLGDFLIDALEMQGVLTQQEALTERLLIADSRYFSDNESTSALTCMLGAAQTGFVVNNNFKGGYIDGEYTTQRGYICNVGEEETYNHQSGTASSQFYANTKNYGLAVSNIQRIRTIQDNDYYSAAGQNIIERINRLANMLKAEVSGLELGRIYWEQMNELRNGSYSRFVGNATYGAYQGDTWVWKPEYKVLGLAASMANGTVIH